MVEGKDKRRKQACPYLAAGNCYKGEACLWLHGTSKGVVSAAAPSSARPKKRDKATPQAPCRQFAQSGKCAFGADCSYSHDVNGRKKPSKPDTGKTLAIKEEKKS
eukprot:5945598-Heterocapsa_arctica.AAC.1